jgi:hypothetical protein
MVFAEPSGAEQGDPQHEASPPLVPPKTSYFELPNSVCCFDVLSHAGGPSVGLLAVIYS